MNTNLTIIVFIIIIITGRLFSSFHRKADRKKTAKQIFFDKAFSVLIIPIASISLPIIEYYFLKDSINPVISGTVAIIIWYGFFISFFLPTKKSERTVPPPLKKIRSRNW